jgi:hypothetical protein
MSNKKANLLIAALAASLAWGAYWMLIALQG